MDVDSRIARFLKRKIRIAKEKRDKAQHVMEKARKRRDYWKDVIDSLENRHRLNQEGQTEFDV